MFASETGGSVDTECLISAIEHIHVKLRGKLSLLIGQVGFTELFRRAIHVARREFPILSGILLGPHPSGELHGTREFVEANTGDLNAARDGLTAIVEHFVSLLVTFIGDELSQQLLVGIWPELGPPAPDHGSEDGDTPNE